MVRDVPSVFCFWFAMSFVLWCALSIGLVVSAWLIIAFCTIHNYLPLFINLLCSCVGWAFRPVSISCQLVNCRSHYLDFCGSFSTYRWLCERVFTRRDLNCLVYFLVNGLPSD